MGENEGAGCRGAIPFGCRGSLPFRGPRDSGACPDTPLLPLGPLFIAVGKASTVGSWKRTAQRFSSPSRCTTASVSPLLLLEWRKMKREAGGKGQVRQHSNVFCGWPLEGGSVAVLVGCAVSCPGCTTCHDLGGSNVACEVADYEGVGKGAAQNRNSRRSPGPLHNVGCSGGCIGSCSGNHCLVDSPCDS